MSLADFNAILPGITVLPSDAARQPHMPIPDFLTGASVVHQRAAEARDLFSAKNFPVQKLDTMPALIGALRHAESKCGIEFASKAAKVEWEEARERSFELREVIVAALTYVFFRTKNEDGRAKLAKINEGAGNADFIQDISDLSVLAHHYDDALKEINVDPNLIEDAEVTAERLSELLAMAIVNRDGVGIQFEHRNKILGALKEITDDIEACAELIYYQDPKKAHDFAIRYLPRKKRIAIETVALATAS